MNKTELTKEELQEIVERQENTIKTLNKCSDKKEGQMCSNCNCNKCPLLLMSNKIMKRQEDIIKTLNKA